MMMVVVVHYSWEYGVLLVMRECSVVCQCAGLYAVDRAEPDPLARPAPPVHGTALWDLLSPPPPLDPLIIIMGVSLVSSSGGGIG